jgi:galactose mutarotase
MNRAPGAARWALLLASLGGAAPRCAAQQAPPALVTRWARDVGPRRVWPEYPRPQMARRAWRNLNGLWDYAIRAKDAPTPQPAAWDGKILVPFPVEAQLSGVRKAVTPDQRLWYRRSFRAPPLPRGGRLLLHFGAVDWDASVYMNGQRVGGHTGGYDPFTFDITGLLRRGDQELVVSAWDPTDSGPQPRGKQVLHPQGIWYTAATGIWQTVWLEPVPATYVTALTIVPDVDSSAVHVRVEAAGASGAPRVRITVLDGRRPVAFADTLAGRDVMIPIAHPKLWSPGDPFLYGLEVHLAGGDALTGYFGMRSIAVARDAGGINRLFLNGRPLFELGTLDQGWWPDGLYTPPTDAAARHDLETLKRLGFNLVRKHVKVEPARWYYWCDRLGLLVWQDMPSGENDTPAGKANFGAELERVVDALRNHPSIVMWVPFNEGWGQHDTGRIVAWLKAHDPTRLVDDASGWTDRGAGDVMDMHDYPGPAMPALEPHRAAVLGEFGGLGLPLPGHLWNERSAWGYRRYATTDSLWSAYRGLMVRLRPLVSAGLAAAVYTQTTDVESEVNGLMTYDRAVMKLPPEAAALHDTLFQIGAAALASQGARVTRTPFGRTPSGEVAELLTLTNAHGMEVRAMTYGGIIVSLEVPDRTGALGDVVLGYDSLAGYLKASPYFGAIVGRYGNRIARAQFTLDGATYHLPANDGANTLHGGTSGFDKAVWQAEGFKNDSGVGVTFTHTSPDGDQGFPGNLRLRVTYTLTDHDQLIVDYAARTDKATPLNLTQHSYFNLAGDGAGEILGHVLWIDADRYTPVDSTLIPTGVLAPVAGTAFDFTSPTAIGARIGADDEQLRRGRGYDHNFVLNRSGAGLVHAARVVEPTTGRTLDVYTTEPGVQFYTGNFLDGTITGKSGHIYRHRNAFCLETQHFPDSPNQPAFPSTILRPGDVYRSETIFAFGVGR